MHQLIGRVPYAVDWKWILVVEKEVRRLMTDESFRIMLSRCRPPSRVWLRTDFG